MQYTYTDTEESKEERRLCPLSLPCLLAKCRSHSHTPPSLLTLLYSFSSILFSPLLSSSISYVSIHSFIQIISIVPITSPFLHFVSLSSSFSLHLSTLSLSLPFKSSHLLFPLPTPFPYRAYPNITRRRGI